MTDKNTIRLKASKGAGAMLGAAFGDALGWPNERVIRSTPKQPQGQLYSFKEWRRRSGGRFFPYEEIISEGEYSDDTQLILCLSRSLLKEEVWWEHFTQIELPFWSVYERGGGGATKRAVESWLNGTVPWSSKRKPLDVKRYFDAGGNGVAMRVLPHVLRLNEKDFPEIAANIFLDGIATHGHPRALLGALAYGFALWSAFRKESKLAYGELVDDLIQHVEIWSALPLQPTVLPEWRTQAENSLPAYMKFWESARIEIMDYLGVCQAELSKGALSLDDDVLEKLQCFDYQISGAGTVAAIAAIYLASRHAADPINGVVKAAFSIGADTDTIASMTAGLLGCINGYDWLSSVKHGIQDAGYIEQNALRLISGHVDFNPIPKPVRKFSLKTWTDNILTVPDSSEVKLPDCRRAKVSCGSDYIGRNGKFKVEFRRLDTEDGQSIYLNKISKVLRKATTDSLTLDNMACQQSFLPSRGCGPKIPVALFASAIWFYRDCLGLTVKKQNSEMVVFDQGLVLVPQSYLHGVQFRAMIYIQATNIAERFRLIKENKLQIVTELGSWGKSEIPFFRCLDPDGNIVEIFSTD